MYLLKLMLSRIVTHNDLDGIFSASLCSAIHGIDEVEFTGPNAVANRAVSITADDIVCDLPYPGECGLWFDHHAGNAEELRRLGVDPLSQPGRFAQEKSCARVIYSYYQNDYDFPVFYGESVREVDKIDSFDFASVAEWRAETPVRIINDSLKCAFRDREAEGAYYRSLIGRLAEQSMAEVAQANDVRDYFQAYLKDEEKMVELIRASSSFHPADRDREFAIIDLTHYPKQTMVVRNLAQIIYPEIYGVFLVQNLYDRGVKTTNLKVSGSLTIRNGKGKKDIGEIMRILNIGDGHPGAGSGQIFCDSKADMERKKQDALDKICQIWHSQA